MNAFQSQLILPHREVRDTPRIPVETFLGIPIVFVVDSAMPPDQVELRNSNGQVVRVVGLALSAPSHQEKP